jgi:hypothetical protein
MSPEVDRVLLYTSMFLPIVFALIVWLDSRRPYPHWAKAASLVACAAGLSWDIITLVQRPLSMSRYPFLLTVSIKQTLGGVFLGIAISIIIAHNWKS